MKVLEKGTGQKGYSTTQTCTGHGNGGGGCGAKLLVEQGDLYKTTQCVKDEKDVFVTFTCPECGVETDLRDPPSHLLEVLPSGRPGRRDRGYK